MNYCESCKYLCESSSCPECGSRELRPVEDNDYCFLVECSSTFGKMLAEILENNGIKIKKTVRNSIFIINGGNIEEPMEALS